MKNVICAWCKTNETDFESIIPLTFIGERNQKLGYTNDFHVLFFEGYHNLNSEYKDSLLSLGYHLHDVFSLYSELAQKYHHLDQFGDYEKKCFLRWPIINTLFPGEGIIHYDGDIVLNQDATSIAQMVTGKTFVLQGCPAFTVINNDDWFKQYKQQLELFVQDIKKYSQEAWNQHTGWEVTFKTRWAGSRFRKIISSDQDLISHLIHTGQLIQDPIEDVLMQFQDYILCENPLFFHFYDENFPYHYVRENGVDYFLCERQDAEKCFYKKRVLFWHLQSCFNFYLAKFIFRQRFLRFLPLSRLPLNLAPRGWEDFINKRLGHYLKHTTRLSVYKYFFERTDFSSVLRDLVWWKRGVFK